MQRLEVSGAVRPLYGSLGVKGLISAPHRGERLTPTPLDPRELTPASIKPLKTELNTICHFLALLGAHHILHVSRIRVKQKSRRDPEPVWSSLPCRDSNSEPSSTWPSPSTVRRPRHVYLYRICLFQWHKK